MKAETFSGSSAPATVVAPSTSRSNRVEFPGSLLSVTSLPPPPTTSNCTSPTCAWRSAFEITLMPEAMFFSVRLRCEYAVLTVQPRCPKASLRLERSATPSASHESP